MKTLDFDLSPGAINEVENLDFKLVQHPTNPTEWILKEKKIKTVLCHGVFDVLHAGHLAYFQEAKKYGDRLIVSLTADRFVNKGPGRPYFSAEKRAAMVRALFCVDEVIISDEPSAIGVIGRLQPDFYVKGSDYKDFAKDVTGEILNEKAAVESYGGKLVFTEGETFSSGNIINKFFAPWTDGQRSTIELVHSLGGFAEVEKSIGMLGKLSVLVVGEPILDIYRFVTPEGISSKSPSISARFNYEETYQGGAIAIQSHLLGFTEHCALQPGAIQKKIRYISGQQRVFEVTEIQETHNKEFIADKMLELAKNADVVILADFGHGLFEGEVLNACKEITKETFVGLNVQTNSSNFGFNVYTKHQRFDYLCLDTREARLAEHDRYSPSRDIAQRVYDKTGRAFGFTEGPNGARLFTQRNMYCSPAFADNIVDATGAGDAYFAITTCLLASGCNPELVPFIGNVFAGLKTKIIGNKSAVSKASLLKACSGILK